METREIVSRNVRLALFSERVPNERWVGYLADRLQPGWTREDVRLLLAGALDVQPQQVDDLSRTLGRHPESLVFDAMPPGLDILRENLKRLIDSVGHGGKKELAATLSVDPTTIYRWLSGTAHPQGEKLRQIAAYFGVSPEVDLATEPLFLSAEPLSLADKRRTLAEKLKRLPDHSLRVLYPALEKLLEAR